MGSVLNATDEESSGVCYTACRFISRQAQGNRQLLATAMIAAGFVTIRRNGGTGPMATDTGR